MARTDRSKPLHCVETITGRNLTGTFSLTSKEIRVDLYSFTDFFHIKVDQAIYLLGQTGEVISLHSNVGGGSGTTSHYDRTIYHQRFISNIAIIGHDQWAMKDKVKRVTFRAKYTMELLRHKKKIEALGRSKYPKEESLKIFEEHVHGCVVKAWYGITYSFDFAGKRDLWPNFEIEFDQAKDINEYNVFVSSYIDFISFCLGVKLTPEYIRIDRLSRLEMVEAAKDGTYRGDHEVHYIWPETEIDFRDLWAGGSPVLAWDEEELDAFRACLVAWMNRADAWKKPYGMMMASFALKNTISAERFINACRWLEEIPTASAKNALSNEDINSITNAAVRRAEELDHGPAIRERIASAIKRVKSESADERFLRLVTMIDKRFGKNILPKNFISHLKPANKFRGKVAHKYFSPATDKEFNAFIKTMLALEALCFLLTALDLPISEEGKGRLRHNPLVRDYLSAFE